MAEPVNAGLKLSYAPTPGAIKSPVIHADDAGALLAAIPAGPLWPQLLRRSLYLFLALMFSAITVGFAILLWHELGVDSSAPYVTTMFAASMVLWMATCVRGIIVVCRFGHLPATVTVAGNELTITYVSDQGPRTRSWDVEDVVGVLLKTHGWSPGKGKLWELSVVASMQANLDVFRLHFFNRDTEFPRRLEEAMDAALERTRRGRVSAGEEEVDHSRPQ